MVDIAVEADSAMFSGLKGSWRYRLKGYVSRQNGSFLDRNVRNRRLFVGR